MLSYQTLPSLFYLHTLCYFINFCCLFKLLPSYQTFVILSPLVIYSLFMLSTHPINAPAVHTTNTTLTLSLSSTRFLRQYIPNSTGLSGYCAILIWGIEAWLGVFYYNKQIRYMSISLSQGRSHLVTMHTRWHTENLEDTFQRHFGPKDVV